MLLFLHEPRLFVAANSYASTQGPYAQTTDSVNAMPERPVGKSRRNQQRSPSLRHHFERSDGHTERIVAVAHRLDAPDVAEFVGVPGRFFGAEVLAPLSEARHPDEADVDVGESTSSRT